MSSEAARELQALLIERAGDPELLLALLPATPLALVPAGARVVGEGELVFWQLPASRSRLGAFLARVQEGGSRSGADPLRGPEAPGEESGEPAGQEDARDL